MEKQNTQNLKLSQKLHRSYLKTGSSYCEVCFVLTIFVKSYERICEKQISCDTITCGTIKTSITCIAGSTRSVRVSTWIRFTVGWTYSWAVCAKISFLASYRLKKIWIFQKWLVRSHLIKDETDLDLIWSSNKSQV